MEELKKLQRLIRDLLQVEYSDLDFGLYRLLRLKRDEVEGFINAAGIRSPGFTSAPAIAQEIVGIMRNSGAELIKKREWNPYRKKPVSFEEATIRERDELIEGNPMCAKIVCQCDLVTHAEIVDAIKKGATTLDGVKFRTQAMMGECQGSFCEFKIAQILAKEIGVPAWAVTKNGPGSQMGIGDITVLVRKKESAKT